MFHDNEQCPLSRKKEKSTVIASIVTSSSSKKFLPASFPVYACYYVNTGCSRQPIGHIEACNSTLISANMCG